jgi:hypothetical protein
MAVTKTILKNTNQESVVKIAGTAASATITLSTDLIASTQAVTSPPTSRVNIAGVQWVGLPGATITITRNSVNILTLPGGGADYIEFAAGSGFVDNIENASDIVVTIAGAEAQCYLTLRKVSGYTTKVETAVYGAYDDETQVGASTTLSGSPDKP